MVGCQRWIRDETGACVSRLSDDHLPQSCERDLTMRQPRVRLTIRRLMLVIAGFAVLLGSVAWARRNVPTTYQEIPTRTGAAQYREYYADGTVRERDAASGRWVRRPKTPSERAVSPW